MNMRSGQRVVSGPASAAAARGMLDADPHQIAGLRGVEPVQIREALRAAWAVGPPGIAAARLPGYMAARRSYSPAVSARMEPWLAPGGMAAGTGVQVSDAGESLVKAV